MTKIIGNNLPKAYEDGLWKMKANGREQHSRNGSVFSIPEPVMLEIREPRERVLFSPIRNANPYFHAMEFCWMMAGSNDARWLSKFNKRMMEYADDGTLRGAYGWRWRKNHHIDQVEQVIHLLLRDRETRQAVLSMWDPLYDGPNARTSDRPCNTHIYFRIVEGRLDMTVCNRSNDMIWGMLGANAVHMTMLHELVALATHSSIGIYRVMTNNLHVYPDMPRYNEIMRELSHPDPYRTGEVAFTPLLKDGESWRDFVYDCEQLLRLGTDEEFVTDWMNFTGSRIHDAYLNKGWGLSIAEEIGASDWRMACVEWEWRRARRALSRKAEAL